jgi:thymidylate synthase
MDEDEDSPALRRKLNELIQDAVYLWNEWYIDSYGELNPDFILKMDSRRYYDGQHADISILND